MTFASRVNGEKNPDEREAEKNQGGDKLISANPAEGEERSEESQKDVERADRRRFMSVDHEALIKM